MTFAEAHRTIKRGLFQVLDEAISKGLSPNATNQYGWTLLMLTALEGNTKIGKLLLERGTNIEVVNIFGDSALFLAAHKGHLPFVKLLLAYGASGGVRPQGRKLDSWLRSASGLPSAKIDAILVTLGKS